MVAAITPKQKLKRQQKVLVWKRSENIDFLDIWSSWILNMSKTLIVKLILLFVFFGPNTTKFISRAMQQCATNTKQKKKPSLNISVQMPLEMRDIWVTFQSSSRRFMLNLWQPNSLYLSSAAKLCVHVSKFVLFAVWNLLFERESATSLIVSLRISSGRPSVEHLVQTVL